MFGGIKASAPEGLYTEKQPKQPGPQDYLRSGIAQALQGMINSYFSVLISGGTGSEAKFAALGSLAGGLGNALGSAAGMSIGGMAGQLLGPLIGGGVSLLLTKLFKLDNRAVKYDKPVPRDYIVFPEMGQPFALPESYYWQPSYANSQSSFSQTNNIEIPAGPKVASRVVSALQGLTNDFKKGGL